MHMHSFAPVLSATSMNVYIWIIGQCPFPSARGFGARRLFHDAQQPPVLVLGERSRLHDLDFIADARLVLLVVHIANGAALDVLAVAGVLDEAGDLDAARLVHL